jgi:hypothetical protein
MPTTKFKDSIDITVSKELKLFVRSISSTYQFVFKQQKFEFVQRADMLELIDLEGVGDLALKFAALVENSKMTLTRKELYLFYTMMELVCRSFLCEIGDEFKEIAMKLNKVSEDKYNSVRSMELSIAQTLIQKIKQDFAADPEFDEIVERLEMLD